MLRSRLLSELGFRHGFNLRTGGASKTPYESLNLGRSVGDEPAHVDENHRRFAKAIGYAQGGLYETSQVHGRDVHVVSERANAADVRTQEADAVVAPPGAIAIGVRSADCVPVLIADVQRGAVAAIHAGWRGTVRGVVQAGVHELLAQRGGSAPHAFAAAIFPHIRRCCFEVGDDVAQTLRDSAGDDAVVDRSRAKPHVDLGAIIALQLRSLGLSPEQIEQVPGCTFCEPERFFSYRRDGQRSGRHLTAIVSR